MPTKTDFAITPDPAELEKMDRKLKFFPSLTQDPTVLTREQIDQFNRDGYLSSLRVFSDQEIADHRDYFDKLLAQATAQGGDSYSISSAHLKHGRVYDLLRHSSIVSLVADLLGPNVVGWGSHYFCKMPHDGKQVAWHQDASYWPLSPSKAVTVWLAIDDADVHNACMKLIAGSHLFGHITHRTSDAEAENVLGTEIEDAERFGRFVINELRAGEISIHSDLLLHGSAANESDRRRCGLTLRYCTADVRAEMQWNQKGVLVRGDDPTGHWTNPSRPKGD